MIHLTKGVQQGGCASPILYIAYANKFAKTIKELHQGEGLGPEDFLVMNWADDVNYMFTDIKDAEKTITALIQIAEDLKLPFSKAKCKLVPLFPNPKSCTKELKKLKKKLREKIGTVL